MKHLNQIAQQLVDWGAGIGVEIDLLSASASLLYLEEVIQANLTLNLTRIVDADSAVRLHILDSVAALNEVLEAPDGPICDIGTGGGFPGVPLALCSRRRCTLLDSVRKKALAVQQILENRGLHDAMQAVGVRAEQHARDSRGQYAVVTARAVGQLQSLVELGAPLLMKGGRLICLKGSPSNDEIEAGDRAARVVGLERASTRDFCLPGGGEHRTIIAYLRIRDSSVPLPRREGLAQHSPLG